MAKSKGLGKGLGALLPSGEQERRTYFICAIDRLAPNPNQPRKQADDESLRQLAASITENGILLPLVVRRADDDEQGERFEIIAGERRWRAARLAALSEVPVLVKDVSPQDQLELALVENIQRRDLNPLEEAEAYLRLVRDYGLTQEEVARRVGRERSTVANALRLNQLPAYAKEDLSQGRLSMGHARALLVLEDEQQQRRLRDQIIDKGLNVRQSEELAKKQKNPTPKSGAKRQQKEPGLTDAYCRSLVNELGQHFATKVRIVQNGNQGKLEIDYCSTDDLERLIGLLRR